MAATKVLSDLPNPPGINVEGLPTINVCGHEVPIEAYFRVVALLEAKKSVSHIVDQVVIASESAPVDRKVTAVIIKAIIENLRVMNGQIIATPTSKRGSLIFSHLKPKNISSYRTSRLAWDSDLSESLAKLQTAQNEESKVINKTLRLAAQRDSVSRIMADGWDKRKTEASLDVEVRKYLKKHHALEAEMAHARKLVEINRSSLR